MYKKLSDHDLTTSSMKDYLKSVKIAVSLPKGWGDNEKI